MSFEKQDFQPRTMPKEEFFSEARALTEEEMRELGGSEKKKDSSLENTAKTLTTSFRNPETGKEKEISFDIEQEIGFFEALYQKNLELPVNKEEILLIWKQNYQEIRGEIEKYGYDSILIVPDDLPKEDILNKKLIETMEETVGNGKQKVKATYQSENFKEGGALTGMKNSEKSGCRIVLTHSEQNIYDNSNANPYLKATLGKNIMKLTGLDQTEVKSRIANNREMPVDFEVEINGQKINIHTEGFSLEEYMVAQRAFFEKTGKHLDEKGWTWLLKSLSGSRVVSSHWIPGDRRLNVLASVPGHANVSLSPRLSHSFKKLT